MQAIICGLGGQGVITINAIIGTLATKLGLEVTSAETHGMAMRGGSVYTSLKIGDNLCPTVAEGCADVILSTNVDEAKRNMRYLKQGGAIITDGELKLDVACKVVCVNANDIAVERFGGAVHAGTILLGAFIAEFSDVFPVEQSVDILKQNKKINIEALQYGLSLKA